MIDLMASSRPGSHSLLGGVSGGGGEVVGRREGGGVLGFEELDAGEEELAVEFEDLH